MRIIESQKERRDGRRCTTEFQHCERNEGLVGRGVRHSKRRIQGLGEVAVELWHMVQDRLQQLTQHQVTRARIGFVAANTKHRETIGVATHPLQKGRLANAGFTVEHDRRRNSGPWWLSHEC